MAQKDNKIIHIQWVHHVQQHFQAELKSFWILCLICEVPFVRRHFIFVIDLGCCHCRQCRDDDDIFFFFKKKYFIKMMLNDHKHTWTHCRDDHDLYVWLKTHTAHTKDQYTNIRIKLNLLNVPLKYICYDLLRYKRAKRLQFFFVFRFCRTCFVQHNYNNNITEASKMAKSNE